MSVLVWIKNVVFLQKLLLRVPVNNSSNEYRLSRKFDTVVLVVFKLWY